MANIFVGPDRVGRSGHCSWEGVARINATRTIREGFRNNGEGSLLIDTCISYSNADSAVL